MNNTFSFSRFGMVLKRDLVENRKRYLGVFFIMFAVFLVYQLSNINDIIELGQLRAYEAADYMSKLASDCLPCFYGILSLALMGAAADMTSIPLQSKTSAINYLMQPASDLEKFLSRAFINTVVVIIMAYVALLCADLVRILCTPLFEVKAFYGLTVPRAWNGWIEPLKETYTNGGVGYSYVNGIEVRSEWELGLAIMAVLYTVLSVLYLHSQFILSGCIWRKRALIKMFLIGLILTIIFVWLLAEMEPLFEDWLEQSVVPWFETTSTLKINLVIFAIGIPFFLIFTIFNWWLSFRLFSRKQMIQSGHLFSGKHLRQLLNRIKK